MADIQRDFLERRVNFLSGKLATIGVELDLLHAETFREVPGVLGKYCEQHYIKEVYCNVEYEINERRRDEACETAIDGVKFFKFHGDVIAEPGSLKAGGGEMYKVFTPFKNAWVREHQSGVFSLPDALPFKQIPKGKAPDPQQLKYTFEDHLSAAWTVADDEICEKIDEFVDSKLGGYSKDRDFPCLGATSKMSPYMALGMVSPAQILAAVQRKKPRVLKKAGAEEFSYVNEIVWREFYRHLVWAWPRLCMHKNFYEKYDGVAWEEGEEQFKKWCEGKTGYPIVDAAMRQLKETGWMHNRLRMVVASFLTKHLLVDWRKGEKFFMTHLIDGDYPSNNGGWQWAASTGCDSQPYFRVFNPTLQSQRFDPDGVFIKQYLPNLSSVPSKDIHNPHAYLALQGKTDLYWPQIVEHTFARERAIAAYKAAVYGEEEEVKEKKKGTKRKRS
eukprot:TRINITY_DN15826_c0_g1_i1.p1 TRINITY_DN15826_c0_g1~~TRINITY_DN15826_c0_g1_i1.p1  ORF type:complete len:507 (+),score=101.74 TRINITY_DN15826_c0_g1_i1:189-1523(+)